LKFKLLSKIRYQTKEIKSSGITVSDLLKTRRSTAPIRLLAFFC